jgi:Nucleotidyl transferase AbiEii toxin, Type IV TA system
MRSLSAPVSGEQSRAMTEHTRPATWNDLKIVARYLEEAGAEYALVGGYALAAHGFNRFTEDIDLLVNPSADNSRRWIAALARLPDNAAAQLRDEPDVFAHDQRYAIRINDELTIDGPAAFWPKNPRNAGCNGRGHPLQWCGR